MRAEIGSDGTLYLFAENNIEAYALDHWFLQNNDEKIVECVRTYTQHIPLPKIPEIK